MSVDVGDGIWRTQADHGAKRYRVQDLAFLFAGAHAGGHARVLALSVDAGKIWRALAILNAFRLDGSAYEMEIVSLA